VRYRVMNPIRINYNAAAAKRAGAPK
jgi:hypothetical protein